MDHNKTNRTRRSAVYADAVINRYTDAYRIAGITVGFGTVVRVVGGVLGAAVLFIGSHEFGLVQALFVAALVAAIFFFIGMLLATQGQVLKATLDTAVNSSPFLTDNQKAIAMSLGNTDPIPDEGYDAPARFRVEPTEVGSFCFHCGGEVTEGAVECRHCGKTL